MPDEDAFSAERSAAVVWAKSWPHDGSEIEAWLPLWQHLDDTADVAGLLWDGWLAPSVRALVTEGVGGDAEDARRLVTWLAGVHDVGKASPAFAVQVPTLADRMRGAGLPFGAFVQQDRAQLRHELAGAALVERWLEAQGVGHRQRRQYSGVIAGHHGTFPGAGRLNAVPGMPQLLGSGPWAVVQDLLLDRAAARAGVDAAALAEVRLPQSVQMLVTGIVVMADWIASGETFPLLPVDDVPIVPRVDTPVTGPSARAVRGVRDVRLGRPWTPVLEPSDVDTRFVDRFPWAAAGPRPVQSAVIELAATMEAPGLVVLEAPMGVGKTEAAFMAAEVLAARTGATGCFVALPTQATSNAMFARMLDWLERVPDGAGVGAQSVALVHGKAALNDDVRRLPFGVREHARVHDEDSEPGESRGRIRAVLGEWTRGRKQAALSAFVVGTIDQVLFAALRARHTMLRHLSLAGKVVVIDEVHAADVYMSTFLDRALEWLAAEGVPVVLLTATLPATRRVELYLAYEAGRRRRLGLDPDEADVQAAGRAALSGDIGYPVLVASGADGPVVLRAEAGVEPRAVRLRRLDDSPEALAALLRERLADGGCAVVVRNTVRRAQETARQLTRVFGAEAVSVAHAGFLAADRAAIDRTLLARFGPSGEGVERPPLHIVVATQVVEQSLDLDFDLMVTDLAPVDLVLQRLGRLHRHRRGTGEADRPFAVRDAVCHLAGVDWSVAGPPGLERGAKGIYGAWPLYAALAVLESHLDGAPVRLPEDIAPLVQAAYRDAVVAPAGWAEAMAQARAAFVERQAARRVAAEPHTVAPVQKHGRDLYDSDRAGAGVVDEDSPQGQGFVRDGGDSIEVVVVQHSGGVDRIPDWVEGGGDELPLRDYPLEPDQARLLARCTLRLPYALCQGRVGDQVVRELERTYFAGWQRTPYLSGQLALVLDDECRAEVAGHHLAYDRRLGLVADGDGAESHVSPTEEGA